MPASGDVTYLYRFVSASRTQCQPVAMLLTYIDSFLPVVHDASQWRCYDTAEHEVQRDVGEETH